MAELFGTAAGVLQVAEVGFNLATTLYKYASTVKGAERDIKRIARDVKLTSKVLERTHEQLKADKQAQLCTGDALVDLEDVLEGCREAFQEVDDALNKSMKPSSGKNVISLTEKLKWPLKQDKLEVLRANLEKLKTTLLLMLSVFAYGSKVEHIHAAKTDIKVELSLEKLQIQNLIQAKDEATSRYEQLSAAFTKLETRINDSVKIVPPPPVPSFQANMISLMAIPNQTPPAENLEGLNGHRKATACSNPTSERLELCAAAVRTLTSSIDAVTKRWETHQVLEHGSISEALVETTAAIETLRTHEGITMNTPTAPGRPTLDQMQTPVSPVCAGRSPILVLDQGSSQTATDSGFANNVHMPDDSDEYEGSLNKPALVRKKSSELVKPALRPSSRRRHSSMPGTSTYSKSLPGTPLALCSPEGNHLGAMFGDTSRLIKGIRDHSPPSGCGAQPVSSVISAPLDHGSATGAGSTASIPGSDTQAPVAGGVPDRKRSSLLRFLEQHRQRERSPADQSQQIKEDDEMASKARKPDISVPFPRENRHGGGRMPGAPLEEQEKLSRGSRPNRFKTKTKAEIHHDEWLKMKEREAEEYEDRMARMREKTKTSVNEDVNTQGATPSKPSTADIWNQLQSNPDFQEGNFDIDGLCSELRAKARDSESGVVVDQDYIDAALRKLGKTDEKGNAPGMPSLMFELESHETPDVDEDESKSLFASLKKPAQKPSAPHPEAVSSGFAARPKPAALKLETAEPAAGLDNSALLRKGMDEAADQEIDDMMSLFEGLSKKTKKTKKIKESEIRKMKKSSKTKKTKGMKGKSGQEPDASRSDDLLSRPPTPKMFASEAEAILAHGSGATPQVAPPDSWAAGPRIVPKVTARLASPDGLALDYGDPVEDFVRESSVGGVDIGRGDLSRPPMLVDERNRTILKRARDTAAARKSRSNRIHDFDDVDAVDRPSETRNFDPVRPPQFDPPESRAVAPGAAQASPDSLALDFGDDIEDDRNVMFQRLETGRDDLAFDDFDAGEVCDLDKQLGLDLEVDEDDEDDMEENDAVDDLLRRWTKVPLNA